MLFDRPLVPAVLVQRYKRFLFDAVLEDGRAITGSCPNTGSMRGLTTPGSRIWLSEHDSPTRKYRHMFEMVEVDGTVVGINTGLPNRLAEEAIKAGQVGDLHLYSTLQREQKYGRNSRIDMLLTDRRTRARLCRGQERAFQPHARPGANFPTARPRGVQNIWKSSATWSRQAIAAS
jgi:sugar fermentation stimulation protein A